MDIGERFESLDGDNFLKFDRVQNKRSNRPDLHAFLLLESLFPGTDDIVSGAEHDKIWLDVHEDQASELSDDQIMELIRCGVMYDDENYCLAMFA
jgi:hypothetical protein